MGKTISTFELPMPEGTKATDVFNSIMVGVNQKGGQTVTWPNPNTLVISRRAAGFLMVLACIVLFPFGLLALLARRTEVLTISAQERDGRLFVSALGEGDPFIITALNKFLAAMSAS